MNWFLGSVQDAVTAAKKSKAFFVVYVEGTDELSMTMTKVLDNSVISSKFKSNNFVAIKLAKGSEGHKQFEEFYKLVPVPSVFFIDQNGRPAEIVVSDASEENVLKKLNNAIEKCIPCSRTDNLQLAGPSSSRTEQPSTSSANNACSSFIAAEASAPAKTDATPTSSAKGEVASAMIAAEGKSPEKMPVTVGSDLAPKEKLSCSNETTSAGAMETVTGAVNPPSDGNDEASIEDRIEKAKVLLEKKKEEKKVEERKKEKESELERRRVGREIQLAKREQQDRELRQLREERERQKKEEALARQRILDQIAQDRAERAQRLSMNTSTTEESGSSGPEVVASAPPPPAAVNADICRLQFKLPTGESKSHSFSPETTLLQVREFIDNNIVLPFSDYQLATTFPRREFTTRENSRDLRSLQLLPSAVILILPLHGGLTMRSSFGWTQMIIDMMWDLAQPVISLSRYISNFIFRRGYTGGDSSNSNSSNSSNVGTTSGSRSQSPPSAGGVPPSYTTSTAQRLGGRTTVKKRGNIYSLRGNNDDNDENNTWNGNSTQQM